MEWMIRFMNRNGLGIENPFPQTDVVFRHTNKHNLFVNTSTHSDICTSFRIRYRLVNEYWVDDTRKGEQLPNHSLLIRFGMCSRSLNRNGLFEDELFDNGEEAVRSTYTVIGSCTCEMDCLLG